MPVVPETSLTRFAADLLSAGGAPRAEAARVANSLVDANLCGHDSHGVIRIVRYVEAMAANSINPSSYLEIVRDQGGVLVGDGGWGFGQVVCHNLLDQLIPRALELGIACGTLRQTAHIGRLGEYAERAAEEAELCTLIVANTHGSGQRVAPVGSKEPRLGTNPICIGIPGGNDGPFILDFGTSATAEGKVRVKQIAGETCPDGWLLDADGIPTNDPNTLYGSPPGSILPMGGDQAYKGFGLSFMIELLAGGLSGGQCAYPGAPPAIGNCATFILICPERGAGSANLLKEAAQVEQFVRSSAPIADGNTVILPGDPERRTREQRRVDGIPLDDRNWQALVDLAGKLSVTVPD